MSNYGLEDYGSPTLQRVALNEDGTLKKGKGQAVKFYTKREMAFRTKTVDGKGEETLLDPKTGKPPIDAKTGLPFHEPYEKVTLMVKVNTPGDKNEVDCVATEYHKREYWPQYKYFLDGNGIPDGHLIDEYEFINPKIITDLHYYGIHTLEQLRDCSDMICNQIPQVWELRLLAEKYLRINSPEGVSEAVTKLRAENDKLFRENQELKSKVLAPNGKPYVMPAAMEEPSFSPEPIKTKELSPEEFKKGKK